jgi:hypothetical protein
MTNYTAIDNFDTPQIPDISDLVKGGTGINNNSSVLQEQMANRTQYLYNRLGGYIDVADVTGSVSISNTYANKLVSVIATANVTLTVAALSTFKKGNRIAFTAKLSGGGGPFWVNIVTAENILKGTVTRTNIWIYDGEMIELVAGSTTWHWTIARGNFDKIGEVELKRFQPANTFLADGSNAQSRAKFPRIWEVVNDGNIVTDTTWLSDPFRYRGQYSTGNGTTDFRRPDYRAMFLRALDLSRGVDLGRFDTVAGGYEADDNKAHNHGVNDPGHDHGLPRSYGETGDAGHIASGGTSPEGFITDKTSSSFTGISTQNSGASEARGKNIGLYPYIYY